MHDIVIRNGTVIDGSDGPRRRADVAVQGDRIVEVGPSVGRGRVEIDGRDRIVAPGFIDSHAHDDAALLLAPSLLPKVSQGVTTCVCGNCGVGLAPLPAGPLPEPLDQMAPGPALRFRTPGAYLDALRDVPAAVNTVPLLGHSAVRAATMDRTDRPATPAERAGMRALVDEALACGYHGVSTGTFYASAAAASAEEIVDVCEPLRRRGGVYAAHIRDESDGIVDAMHEAAAVGRALGAVTILSHHKLVGVRNHGRAAETLALFDALGTAQPLALDAYPYEASATVLRADRVALASRTLLAHSGPFPSLAGRDVSELARELGLDLETLCRRLQPAAAIYFSMDPADVERIVSHPGVMIGSDGVPLQTRPHPRLWGSFARVLGPMVRDRRLFSLERAVHKMTGLPARRFGLADRGRIAPGLAADLCVFEAQTIADRATFDAPEQPAQGIDWVLVNGQVAWQAGQPVARAGRVLARPAG